MGTTPRTLTSGGSVRKHLINCFRLTILTKIPIMVSMISDSKVVVSGHSLISDAAYHVWVEHKNEEDVGDRVDFVWCIIRATRQPHFH